MFRNIVFSAFGAAVIVCLAVSLLQAFTTEPLILHAEQFEGGAGHHEHAAGAGGGWFAAWAHETPAAGAGSATGEPEEWGPADGFERVFYTVLANLVIGFAGALIILGFMTLRGGPIDVRSGLLWGIGAFFALSLLPSLGLPPELPGTPAADIIARQTWWLSAAGLSAAGIALIVFARAWWWAAGGAVLIALPHLIGAPVPPSHDVAYPGALAGEFVIASLVVSATLWIGAGAVAGWLYPRIAARA